mmetsp:Transcript_11266/g.13924  ORF Transcript_11266/g.13924 Transcript_11266/m.13924 type:complete len:237 (-) Transcript_11266:372-1082(-)
MLQKLKQAKLLRQQKTTTQVEEKKEPETPPVSVSTEPETKKTEKENSGSAALPASFFDNPPPEQHTIVQETQEETPKEATEAKLSNRELFKLLEEEDAKNFQQITPVAPKEPIENVDPPQEDLPDGFFDSEQQNEENTLNLDKAFEDFQTELAQENGELDDFSDNEEQSNITREVLLEKEEEKEHLEHLRKITSTRPAASAVPDIKLKTKQKAAPLSDESDEDESFSLFDWRSRKI